MGSSSREANIPCCDVRDEAVEGQVPLGGFPRVKANLKKRSSFQERVHWLRNYLPKHCSKRLIGEKIETNEKTV